MAEMPVRPQLSIHASVFSLPPESPVVIAVYAPDPVYPPQK